MKVYDVLFNNGIDVGAFLVMAECPLEAYAKAKTFLSILNDREMRLMAGYEWKLFGVQEKKIVNGIIIP